MTTVCNKKRTADQMLGLDETNESGSDSDSGSGSGSRSRSRSDNQSSKLQGKTLIKLNVGGSLFICSQATLLGTGGGNYFHG